MANQYTLATPVSAPQLTDVRITKANGLDDTLKRAEIDIELRTADGAFRHQNTFTLVISNEACTALVPNPQPGTFDEMFLIETRTAEDNPALSQAFETVFYAWFTQGGNTGVLAALGALGLLPPGVAS